MTRDPRYVDTRTRVVDAAPQDVWRVVEGLGGDAGWYSVPGAWPLRGALDRLVGGVGMRRGRRDPQVLRAGEAVDSWRVEQLHPGRRLVLVSEMRLPGAARLELAVEARDGRTVLTQRVLFSPDGAAGHAYWWAVAPLHGLVFGRMAGNISGAAERARTVREAVR